LRSGDSPVRFFSREGPWTISRTSLPSCEKVADAASNIRRNNELNRPQERVQIFRRAEFFIVYYLNLADELLLSVGLCPS